MEATTVWREIERSESYLVCSMYEEAESLSSSNLKNIFGNVDVLSEEDHQLNDMLESAGMVLVQSLHGLGRAGEIVDEFREVFGEIASIPVQVLLTGICLQISNGSYSGVREILEEFFSIWVYEDDRYILCAEASAKGLHGKVDLDIDEYMEVVELYTFGVLGKVSNDLGLAISWVEKAALPEERRQGLLRRLHSLLSLKTAKAPETGSFEEDSKDSSYPVVNSKSLANEQNDEIGSLLKFSKRHESSSHWSSHPLSIKLGKTQFTMSKGRVAVSLVGLIICYALHRKRAAFIRIIRRQMESTKKAIVDFWKLAFSYQVNPLAAIQSIPSTT